MADMIMDDNACMVVGEAAWHGKGVRLEIPPSTEEALRLARLDWMVHKEELYLKVPGAQSSDAPATLVGPDGAATSFQMEHAHAFIAGRDELLSGRNKFVPVEGHATVRYDIAGKPHVLGIVGKKYEVLQNREAFEVFDKILLGRGCAYETAGAIRDGRRVWILARLPESFYVGGDEVRRYFLLVLSHDGSTPLLLKPTPVRVVCNNTLNLALEGKNSTFSIRHTRNIRSRLSEVVEAISMAEMDFTKAKEHMLRMTEFRLLDPTPYFFRVMPELKRAGDDTLQRNVWKHRFSTLVDLHHFGRGNYGKSLWHAYNAMVEWVDHCQRSKDWVENTQFGSGDRIKRRAFTEARVMTETVQRPSETVTDVPWFN